MGYYQALKLAGVRTSGLRWIVLDAPKRTVWGERMAAWFEYKTNRDGEDLEDEISEADLVSMRTEIQALVQQEATKLQDAALASPDNGSASQPSRIVLVGSSQGASMALDVALTMPG